MKSIEKKHKQTQRIIRNFSWTITICFLAFGVYKIYMFQSKSHFDSTIYDYTYPNFITIFAYGSGAIFGSLVIPAIFWLIYFLLVRNNKNKLNNLNQHIINKIILSEQYEKEFRNKLNALKQLLEVKVISVQEFEMKKKLLVRKTEKLVN
jgi:hypothetical protein